MLVVLHEFDVGLVDLSDSLQILGEIRLNIASVLVDLHWDLLGNE